jgi:predicted nuclease of predicted toxin-antitoxin system
MAESLVIVSKDSDLRQMAFLSGPPPNVVWIAIGNCTTDDVSALLRQRRREIAAFVVDPRAALLTLG